MRLLLVPDAAKSLALGAGAEDGATIDLVNLARALGVPARVRFSGGRTSESLSGLKESDYDEIPFPYGLEMGGAVLRYGLPAALDALDEVMLTGDLGAGATNWLSFIDAKISAAIRRAVLLFWLEKLNWNMQHVGETLKLGGTQGVLRAIKTLGGEVADAYQAARERGLIIAGGRRARIPANYP